MDTYHLLLYARGWWDRQHVRECSRRLYAWICWCDQHGHESSIRSTHRITVEEYARIGMMGRPARPRMHWNVVILAEMLEAPAQTRMQQNGRGGGATHAEALGGKSSTAPNGAASVSFWREGGGWSGVRAQHARRHLWKTQYGHEWCLQ